MQYEIHIGSALDENLKKIPRQIIIITEDQRDILVNFADHRKDEDLNTVYRINSCEFTIVPQLNINKDLTLSDITRRGGVSIKELIDIAVRNGDLQRNP